VRFAAVRGLRADAGLGRADFVSSDVIRAASQAMPILVNHRNMKTSVFTETPALRRGSGV